MIFRVNFIHIYFYFIDKNTNRHFTDEKYETIHTKVVVITLDDLSVLNNKIIIN